MKNKGFTLIELMVAVAIIGIISSIAMPAYGAYVKKSKLATATSLLSSHSMKMGQFYADSRSYANGANCGVAPVGNEYFTASCAISGSGVGFTTTMSTNGTGGTGAAGDYEYTIDDANSKKTVKFDGATVNEPTWRFK